MEPRFRHHYTAAEATALLPDIVRWLYELRILRQQVDRMDERLRELLHDFGDQGGERVEDWLRHLARLGALQAEFRKREIRVKDLDSGLVVLPALHGGREVYLSWEEGEDRVEFWHELDQGHGGRAPM